MDDYAMISKEDFKKRVKTLITTMMLALNETKLEAQDMMIILAVIQQFAKLLEDDLFDTKEEQ